MGKTLHVRLDDATENALRILQSSDGGNSSDAVRAAIRETAARRRSRSALRAEVERLMNDPADREETKRVREFMDELAAPIDLD